MTEHEWRVCSDPKKMMECLRGTFGERKLRLLAVGCCRRIWQLLADERSRKGVELAEVSADHPVSPAILDAVSGAAEDAVADALAPDGVTTVEARDKAGAACTAASYASNSPAVRESDALEVLASAAEAAPDTTLELLAQVHLIRDIFGNPFRPITLDPACNTSNIVALAQMIYDDRAFDRLPILADALEDAGCTNADILDHCRQPGEHVRGCWVVDLLLGKK
jgi:hypothetical protein